MDNFFDYSDPDRTSSRVIANSFLLFSIEEMAGGARAFLNFTRQVLVHDFASAPPLSQTVVRVLEKVPADAEVVAACRRLKDRGSFWPLTILSTALNTRRCSNWPTSSRSIF